MRIKSILLILILGVFSGSANAAMTLIGLYDGVNDGDASQLETILLSGNNLIPPDPLGLDVDLQEHARVDVVDLSAGAESDGDLTVTGTVFKVPAETPAEAIAGTWDWTGAGSLDYLTIKFDSWLAVYEITAPTISGDWSTQALCADYSACNANDKPFAISHAAGYSVVPVPAAVWLFASGLLGLIGVARKRT